MEKIINHIDEDREKICKYFTENNYIKDSKEEISSPINKCRIVKKEYKQSKEDLNWIASKIEIYDENGALRKTILIDNEHFFYKFIEIGQTEFLLFSEVLCGGNCVLNLNNFELFGFSDGTDGFICAEYYASPDKKRLAALGCFWAGLYFVKIFDITEIENLPWPCVQEIHLKEDGEIQLKWISERELHIREFDDKKLIQDQDYLIK